MKIRFLESMRMYDAPSKDAGAGAAVLGQDGDIIIPPVPGNSPTAGDPPPPPPPGTPPVEGAPPAADAYQVNAYWDILAKKLSNENAQYEVPESVRTGRDGEAPFTAEQSFDAMAKVIQENTRIPELEDPFIREYVTESRGNKDFNLSTWINDRVKPVVDMSNLSDRDFVQQAYQSRHGQSEQNPNGWTEEEIIQELDRMGRIQLQKERTSLQDEFSFERNKQIEKDRASREIENQRVVKQLQDVTNLEIEKLSTHFSKDRNVNGIEFGESDINDAINEYTALSKFDKEGNRPIYDIFNEEQNLFKAFLLLRNDGELLKGMLGGIKYDAAKSILDGTSLTPSSPAATSGSGIRLPQPTDFIE